MSEHEEDFKEGSVVKTDNLAAREVSHKTIALGKSTSVCIAVALTSGERIVRAYQSQGLESVSVKRC